MVTSRTHAQANVVLGVTSQLNNMVEDISKSGGKEAKAKLGEQRTKMFLVAIDWTSDAAGLSAAVGLVVAVVAR